MAGKTVPSKGEGSGFSLRAVMCATIVASMFGLAAAMPAQAAEPAVVIPPPVLDPAPPNAGPQTIVLAGGCFWGVQGVFEHV
jgi:peptide-methionine (S)-S-oxide reductase